MAWCEYWQFFLLLAMARTPGLARVRALPGAIGRFFFLLQWIELATFLENGASASSRLPGSNWQFFLLLLAMARTSDLLRKWGYHEFEPCREQLAVFSSCNGSNSRPFKNLENGAIASSSLAGSNWQFFLHAMARTLDLLRI